MAIEIVTGLCFAGAGILVRGKNIDGLIAAAVGGVAGGIAAYGIKEGFIWADLDVKIQRIVIVSLACLVGGLGAYFGVKATCLPLSLLRAVLISGAGALTAAGVYQSIPDEKTDMIVGAVLAAMTAGLSTLASGVALIAAQAFGFGK